MTEFKLSYFKSKRWCCESAALNVSANLESSAVATSLERVSFHFNAKKGQCQRIFKLPHNCNHLTQWQSNAQFSKPGFNNMRTMIFQIFKLVLEQAEEPEIKLPTSAGLLKKQESSRKTSTSAILTMPKSLPVWITTNYGKFFKRLFKRYENYSRDGNTRPPDLPPEKSVCRSRSKS